jgi:hypothetical protein
MAPAPKWTTSSYGEATDTTPGDLAALGQHIGQCSRSSGRLVAMQCGAQKLKGVVTARLVSTLAVVLAAVGAFLLLL